jgi:hypothetical protein
MTTTETPLERFDREMREQFPTETSRLDSAAEAFADASAALIRPDGTPKYGEAEHQERVDALLGRLDTTLATVTEAADAAVAKAEADITRLEGADGWEKLSEAERQTASVRQVFIREDAEGGRPDQIVKQARAALVANDKAACYLWARYLRKRVDGGDTGYQGELAGVLHDLEAVFGDLTKKREQRQTIERRIESAKYLKGKVHQARSVADGSRAAALERMRQDMRSRF